MTRQIGRAACQFARRVATRPKHGAVSRHALRLSGHGIFPLSALRARPLWPRDPGARLSLQTMRVAVIGGGMAGLGTALALARDDHKVTILERDDTPMPDSPDDAFDHWERRGAPQVRHSHAFL